MMEQSIKDRYFELLNAHIAKPGEEYLVAIAELGRQLVLADVPLEDIGEIHEQEFPQMSLIEAVLSTSTAMMEMLMAYGLAFRARNEQLQREIAECAHHYVDGIWR